MTGRADVEQVMQAQSGSVEAMEKLVTENSGLIWSVARRFFGRGIDGDDLYQLGCLGFIKAVRAFDPQYGTQFSTYAVPKISGEIRRFLRDDGTVKVSRGLKEQARAVKNARDALEQRLGREPQLSELCEATGLTREEIACAVSASNAAESLQQENGEGGLTLEAMLGDYSQEETLVEHVALREAIRALPGNERMAILLRYYRGLTQQATAKILGVSQVQISRLERRAIEKLKKEMDG
ncbi:MAG: sigma-70 family RNA polymerase sigma factor [Oscillospiraceae bacterium]|nr:sigma-70 family RNA polymerase sigma factor [Oscillospiraceae bacterium]